MEKSPRRAFFPGHVTLTSCAVRALAVVSISPPIARGKGESSIIGTYSIICSNIATIPSVEFSLLGSTPNGTYMNEKFHYQFSA